MHKYMFHIGDYMSDTWHLTWQERGIYLVLMNQYYLSEKPLDKKTVYLNSGAKSPEDIEAVESILNRFFRKTKSGWEHKRCSEVIQDYHLAAERNRSNGKLGGRRKKPTDNPGVISENPDVTQTVLIDIPEKEKKKAPAKRKHTLPDGWEPSLSLIAWAKEAAPTVDPVHEIAQFSDYHNSNGNSKLDWDATYRTWIRNAKKFAKTAPSAKLNYKEQKAENDYEKLMRGLI